MGCGANKKWDVCKFDVGVRIFGVDVFLEKNRKNARNISKEENPCTIAPNYSAYFLFVDAILILGRAHLLL